MVLVFFWIVFLILWIILVGILFEMLLIKLRCRESFGLLLILLVKVKFRFYLKIIVLRKKNDV